MTSYYWIKFYHEILDDPKMATLPDRLWRRFAELCLLAGRFGKSGELPDTPQLAWALRMNTDDLALDLDQLTTTGMIEQTKGGWLVVNFVKRQAAVGDAERKANERKRDKTEQYYSHDSVTDASRNVTQRQREITDTDIESESETDTERDSARFTQFQKWIEQATGYPVQTNADIQAINELMAKNATEADIQAAVAFFRDNQKIARGAAHIKASVITAMAKRTQKGAKSPQPAVEWSAM